MKDYLKLYMPEELTYEEAEDLDNFVEDALSFDDVLHSIEDEDVTLDILGEELSGRLEE